MLAQMKFRAALLRLATIRQLIPGYRQVAII